MLEAIMKFNRKKFFRNFLFLILFVVLILLGVYLWKVPEARERIYLYYSDFLSNFRNEEVVSVQEVFSLSYDPAVQTTIVPGKDGVLVINKSGISEYTTSKNPIWVKEMNISNPIIATDGERFVIAESGGKKVMSFNSRTMLWEKECQGTVEKVFVNKLGYIGVIFSQTGYKSGFLFLNPDGQEICTKLFAKTTLIDLDISPKGDFVAMIEADTATATVSSAISFMSSQGEITYSSIENDTLLSGIRFLDNTNVVAIGDNKLIRIDKEYNKVILDDFKDKTVSGINLENSDKIIKIYRTANSIFADKSTIDILNVNNKKTGTGEVSGVVKAVESTGKTIAVVLADRIDFFDISGRYLNTLNISGNYKSIKLFSSGDYACIDLADTLKVVRVR